MQGTTTTPPPPKDNGLNKDITPIYWNYEMMKIMVKNTSHEEKRQQLAQLSKQQIAQYPFPTDAMSEEEYRVRVCQVWMQRWKAHPLNKSKDWHKKYEIPAEEMALQLKFDWERFVLNYDCVLRYCCLAELPSKPPPDFSKLRQMRFRNGSSGLAPYQTFYSPGDTEDKIATENQSLINYDWRTHYKFTVGNYEAAMKITRHIWSPRMTGKGNQFKKIISQVCYEFLRDLRDEITGYKSWLLKEMNNHIEPHVEYVINEGSVSMTESEEEQAEEFDVEYKPRFEWPEYDITNDEENEYHLQTAVQREAPDHHYVETMNTTRFCMEPEVRPLEMMPKDNETIVRPVFYPKREIGQVNRKKQKKVVATGSYFENLTDVYLQIGRPDLALKCIAPIRFQWIYRKIYRPDNVITQHIGNLRRRQGMPIRIRNQMRRRAMRRAFQIPQWQPEEEEPEPVPVQQAPEDVFDFSESEEEEEEAEEEEEETSSESEIEWEAQGDDHPACVANYRDKILRMATQYQTMLRKHQDKMMVLSHRDRFAYLKRWDLALFEKQRRTIQQIDSATLKFYRQVYDYEKFVYSIPKSYVEEAEKLVSIIDVGLVVRNDRSLWQICDALVTIKERWNNHTFDVRRTTCWVAQADDKPVLKSSAGGSGGSSSSTGTTEAAKIEKPIVSGEKKVNITMVDQRAKEETKTPTVKPTTEKKETSGTDAIYSMLDVVKRPMFIDRFTWSSADAMGKELIQYILPYVYFNAQAKPATVCQNLNASYIMSMFGSAKFDMKIRLQINSVKFQQGLLLCYFKPFYHKYRGQDLPNNLVQFPHVKIDASVSNTVELTVPWAHFRNCFPMYSDPHLEYNYLGTFHVRVWNALATGANSSDSTSISVWMWLENLQVFQLCNPKPPGKITFASTVRTNNSNEDITNKLNHMELAHIPEQRTILGIEWEPQAALAEGVLEAGAGIVADVGADLVEKLLSSVARGGKNDSPISIMPPKPIIPTVMPNSAFGEGVEIGNRLSLHPLSITKPPKGYSKPVDMMTMIKQWSRVGTFEWSTENSENSSLMALPVLPGMKVGSGGTYNPPVWYQQIANKEEGTCDFTTPERKQFSVHKRDGSMLDYLSRMFLYWRGGLKWKFEIVCTNMHSGRLLLRYEPYGTTNTASLECQKMATPGVVWDVQEKHDLELETPYMSVQPWLQTQFVALDYAQIHHLYSVSSGVLEITVVNKLKVTTGISPKVNINVYLAAGDDFRFSCLSPLDGLLDLRWSWMTQSGSTALDTTNRQKFFSTLWEVIMFPLYKTWNGTARIQVGTDVFTVAKDATQFGPFVNDGPQSYRQFIYNLAKLCDAWDASTGDVKYSTFRSPDFDTLEEAYNWVCKEKPWGFTTAPQVIPMSRINRSKVYFMMAMMLLKEKAWNYNYFLEVKSIYRSKSTARDEEWEPQSNDTAKGPTINPFKTFTQDKVPNSALHNDDFMSFYSIGKRFSMWQTMEIPELSYDFQGDITVRSTAYQEVMDEFSKMTTWERDHLYLSRQIPVTPCTPFHQVGSGKHIFVNATNKNRIRPIGNPDYACDMGELGTMANFTTVRYISELFTFWKGSLRYRFTFTNNYNRQTGDNAMCYIVYHPRQFIGAECFYKAKMMTKKRVRDFSRMGMVLYSGNVMGSIDVEVPFYSKYEHLIIDDTIADDTTMNGCLSIITPMQYDGVWACQWDKTPPDPSKMKMYGLSVDVWTAIGDDFEWMVPRAAPAQIIWKDYFGTFPTPDENTTGYDNMGAKGDEITPDLPPYPLRSVMRELRGSTMMSDTDWANPILTTTRVYTGLKDRLNNDVPIAVNLKSIKKRFEIKTAKSVQALQWEPQMMEEEGPELVDPTNKDEVDTVLTGVFSALKMVPEVVSNFHKLATTANESLTKAKEAIEVTQNAMVATTESAETIQKEVVKTSNKIATVATYAFNATRIGLFFHGLNNVIKAESWSDRWMPIAQCALALGLSPDVVTKAGEWMCASLATILGPKQVHEDRNPQGYEDLWEADWSVFLERNSYILRMIAAGIVTIITFYVTSDCPITSKVSTFATSALNKLKNFAIIGSAVKTLDWMFKWVGETIKNAVITVSDYFTGGMVTAHRMSQYYPEILKWLQGNEVYSTEATRMQLAWDVEARFALWKQMDAGEELLGKVTVKSGALFSTISRGMTQLQKAHDAMIAARAAPAFREDPFHICLYGDSGVQKSSTLMRILTYVCNMYGYPKKNRFYARSEEDDYWSGYSGQVCVMMDDIYQDRKAKGIKELIKMKSNMPWAVNMASVEDKGRPFISKIIGSTTNVKYPEPPDIVYPRALWRRRDVLAEMRSTAPKGSTPQAILDGLRFNVIEACPVNIGDPRTLVRDLNLENFMYFCSEAYDKWAEVQGALVFSSLQGKEVKVINNPQDDAFKENRIQTPIDNLRFLIQSKATISDDFLKNTVSTITLEELEELKSDEVIWTALKHRKIIVDYSNSAWIVRRLEDTVKDMANYTVENKWKKAELLSRLGLALIAPNAEHKMCMTPLAEGKLLTELAIVLPEPVKPEEEREAQVGEDMLDELLGSDDFETYADNAMARATKKREAARSSVKNASGLMACYEGVISEIVKLRPVYRTFAVSDDKEMEAFVNTTCMHLTPEARKDVLAGLKESYNNVNKPKLGDLVKQEIENNFHRLFVADELKDHWSCTEKGDWKMTFKEEELKTDKEFADWSMYTHMIEEWTQEKINERKELVSKPPKDKACSVVKTIRRYMAMTKSKITEFFENHPKLVKMLKILGSIATLIAGYQFVNWVCPTLIEKIKYGLLWILGLGSKDDGEARYTRIRERGNEIIATTRSKLSGYYEGVRNMMRKNEDPQLQEWADDDSQVIRVAEALSKQLKNTKGVLQVSDYNRQAEGRSKVNPYMLGQDRVHESSEVRREPIPKYVMQGSEDTQATSIRQNLLSKNCCRIMWTNGERVLRMSAMFVGGRTLLVPYHFFKPCLPGQMFEITMVNGVKFYEVYQPERCVKLPEQDACVYECGIRVGQFKKIINHFSPSNEILMSKVPATLNLVTEDSYIVVHKVEANLLKDISYEAYGERIVNKLLWEYECDTQPGDCGAPLLASSTRVRCKLMGIHVCGAKGKNNGGAAIITSDALEQAIAQLPCDSAVLPTPIEPTIVTKPVETMKMIPHGNFEYLGAVEPALSTRLPFKTEIEKSPIYEMVREHVTEPSVLSNKDPRLEVEGSPLVRALSKYGNPTLPFPPHDLDHVAEDIQTEVMTWPLPMGKEVLSDYKAVFGDELIEYCDRMNLGASPGYPWTVTRPSGEKGKAYLYDANSVDGIANERYRQTYHEREMLAKRGVRLISLWTDCLKDERRPLEKIKTGKTRAFMLPPADFVQLCRKYFMAFCVCFYSHNCRSFSAVGLDPYSYDWTRLVRRMKRKSNLAFGGDFHSFDGIFDPDILWKITKIINHWYKHNNPEFKEEDNVVREVLMEEVIHTTHICLNSVYRKFQGNPSGNPLTVIINTFAHCFYVRLAWLELARRNDITLLSMREFHRNVAEIYYGDDGLLTVKYDVKDVFNLSTVSAVLSEHHIEYTSESKGETYTVRPFHECTFLKNGFKKLEGTYFWLAPISVDTIYELTNWVKKSEDPIYQLRENLEDALKFAFHHGKEFYESFRQGINAALRAKQLREIGNNYSHHLEQFLALCQV